ncbi:hypothetical protein [Azospirillum thermophilum]|uniref:hypothetical protein n=1 Tax=Azospirillum thermophilum TaxID=2202148 RepID=UPI001B3BDD5E|nr:hypothetical protein [Azospirillum thermophilum]
MLAPDLAALAQMRPGESVRFRRVTAAEARVAYAGFRKAIDALPGLVRPAGADLLDSERLLSLNLVDGMVDAFA